MIIQDSITDKNISTLGLVSFKVCASCSFGAYFKHMVED